MSVAADDAFFLREAIRLARESVDVGGGPFGALVVRDGEIVGRGANRVIPWQDPTAHAEVAAIRDACRHLGDHRLYGATLYVSCEPCPMCRAAACWARLDRVVHAASAADAAAAGFDDERIRDELVAAPEARRLPLIRTLAEEGRAVFDYWERHANRRLY
ncbi:nucleoside deaminase [Thioalkalivibrio sp. ALE20]|uniref:nucleoside deaminase n=1 Tax=Thioalkalivibrio sp. ALE20 TaxID=545275 RepID=UPI00037EC632|nr:nucleoside deaminase [Thioalkalivibrio sp. ALE20]